MAEAYVALEGSLNLIQYLDGILELVRDGTCSRLRARLLTTRRKQHELHQRQGLGRTSEASPACFVACLQCESCNTRGHYNPPRRSSAKRAEANQDLSTPH